MFLVGGKSLEDRAFSGHTVQGRTLEWETPENPLQQVEILV